MESPMANGKYEGRVLALREQNLYHDSYFKALVWDDETDAPEWIEYGATAYAGWTHMHVDATPEIRAKYDALLQAERERRAAKQREHAANTPDKGKRVKVVKGRKVPIGTEGVVFWYGAAREYGAFPRGGYKEHGRSMAALARATLGPDGHGEKEGYRIGLKTDSGEKFFTAATNVEVVADVEAVI